jgi:uncharacterized membrane protein
MKNSLAPRFLWLALLLILAACTAQSNNATETVPERGISADIPEGFFRVVSWIATTVEAVGVLIILIGIIVASSYFLRHVRKGEHFRELYDHYRRRLGQSILLGLEFLVAADIIGTVAATPTFQSLGVLGLIILIRTFLSFALEVEINGYWPWQRSEKEGVSRSESA